MSKIKTTCQVCGKETMRWPCHVKRVTKFVVCSKECKIIAMKGYTSKGTNIKVEKICEECGDKFSVWPYVLRKGYGHFCSPKCRKKRAGDKLQGMRRRENVINNCGDHCEMIINTKNGIVKILFDTADFVEVDKHTWTMSGNGYAMTGSRKNCVLLHRFIMNTPPDMDTDHKDGNTLDNRRFNLRICTTSQNTQNSRKKGKGIYKCVYKTRNGTYSARIKRSYIGTFQTAELAAMAYNDAAKKEFGDFAKLNEI